jgi:hypothetical protein
MGKTTELCNLGRSEQVDIFYTLLMTDDAGIYTLDWKTFVPEQIVENTLVIYCEDCTDAGQNKPFPEFVSSLKSSACSMLEPVEMPRSLAVLTWSPRVGPGACGSHECLARN